MSRSGNQSPRQVRDYWRVRISKENPASKRCPDCGRTYFLLRARGKGASGFIPVDPSGVAHLASCPKSPYHHWYLQSLRLAEES